MVTFCSRSGGYNREECLRTVECYDLKTDSWSFIAPMRTPRARFQMAVLMVRICKSYQQVVIVRSVDNVTLLNITVIYLSPPPHPIRVSCT